MEFKSILAVQWDKYNGLISVGKTEWDGVHWSDCPSIKDLKCKHVTLVGMERKAA